MIGQNVAKPLANPYQARTVAGGPSTRRDWEEAVSLDAADLARPAEFVRTETGDWGPAVSSLIANTLMDMGGLVLDNTSAVANGEAQARQLLKQMGLDGQAPIDPFAIASTLGLAVQHWDLPSNVSGQLHMAPSQQATIVINNMDSTNRRRFTCAHEIGHYLRCRGRELTHPIVDERSVLAGLGVDAEEIFANQFAAALLMPAGIVQRQRADGKSVEAMAKFFATSQQALTLRLRNLRLE